VLGRPDASEAVGPALDQLAQPIQPVISCLLRCRDQISDWPHALLIQQLGLTLMLTCSALHCFRSEQP